MTSLLAEAFTRAMLLPPEDQDALAVILLAEMGRKGVGTSYSPNPRTSLKNWPRRLWRNFRKAKPCLLTKTCNE